MNDVVEPVKLTAVQVGQQLARILSNVSVAEFIPNPGNGGDALINAGAWQLFQDVGISKKIVRPVEGGVLPQAYIYPGGGNLVPLYDNASSAIRSRLEKGFQHFVMLPHTIRGHEQLLARADERFHFFCRDLTTWRYIRTAAPQASCYLADDLAFSIRMEWLFSLSNRLRWLLEIAKQPRTLKRYIIWRQKIRLIVPSKGDLRLMRVDEESRGHADVDPTYDISAQYRSDFSCRGEAELVTRDFLTTLSRADRIETDRLHVGIGASLLGKNVTLYDNSYGKNRAIYDLSIDGRFPGTSFIP